MKLLAVLGAAGAALAASLSVAFVGHAATKPSPVARTLRAASERYAIDVRITRAGKQVSLHIRGRASRDTISVRLESGGVHSAVLLDGAFLYEHAPSSVVVQGGLHWLRLPSTPSKDVASARVMSPGPLLALVAAARDGRIDFDAAAVRRISQLEGGLEFRHLRISTSVGRDGLVHRIVLTGRTGDGRTRLSLHARLFAFGQPVHVTPPAPGTFLDERLAKLTA